MIIALFVLALGGSFIMGSALGIAMRSWDEAGQSKRHNDLRTSRHWLAVLAPAPLK